MTTTAAVIHASMISLPSNYDAVRAVMTQGGLDVKFPDGIIRFEVSFALGSEYGLMVTQSPSVGYLNMHKDQTGRTGFLSYTSYSTYHPNDLYTVYAIIAEYTSIITEDRGVDNLVDAELIPFFSRR